MFTICKEESLVSIVVKPGTRLYSAVCDGQLIVVKAPGEPVNLTIGGVPARTTPADRETGAAQEPGAGTAIGKRYTDPGGLVELLCTKPGHGVPALDGVDLAIKDSKPLPASD